MLSVESKDSVRKETHVVSATKTISVGRQHNRRASGNRCGRRQKGQSSFPASGAQTQTNGKKPSKGSGLRGKVLLEQEARLRAEISQGESEDTLRLMGSPARRQRKEVRQDQLHY